ncbi:hypothetical protein PLIP_a1365 [Pseudoalteromonas lipolytica LMEB 39]|nr:hypothetical protein [Pseudoalteromonas lipolytica LMEB 39]
MWYSAIKTSRNGNKGDQKRQTAEQLWQKNGNRIFASTHSKIFGIVYS